MLRLFAIENAQFNDDMLFVKWLALVDGVRRQKVNALATRVQKNRSLAAGALLSLALRECCYDGVYTLGYGVRGKPFFVSPAGVFFNLSHSGDYTVLAVSDGEVGCDIQQMGTADLRIADRYFTEGEKAEIIAAGDGARALFYRMWAAKESYLKALGDGLGRPLNSFGISFAGGSVEVCDGLTDRRLFVAEVGGIPGYALAVCSQTPVDGVEVEWLNANAD